MARRGGFLRQLESPIRRTVWAWSRVLFGSCVSALRSLRFFVAETSLAMAPLGVPGRTTASGAGEARESQFLQGIREPRQRLTLCFKVIRPVFETCWARRIMS